MLKKATETNDNVLFVTAQDMKNSAQQYIWHCPSSTATETDETEGVNQMTKLIDIHGFDHNVSRMVPSLSRCFKHDRRNMVGILAFVDNGSVDQWFGWAGEYNSSEFKSTQDDFSPSSGFGTLHNDPDDSELTDFTGKVASSNSVIDSSTSYLLPIFGYHGDLQGRLHYKYPFLNRWNVRKETDETDTDNYVGRVSYDFMAKVFDAWNPKKGEDDDGLNDQTIATQAGCRPGVLGDSNGLIPTKLGDFFKDSARWDDYDNGRGTDTVPGTASLSYNGCTCMFPTTWNGNISLMYPTFS